MATKTCFKCCCRIWQDAFTSNIDGVTVVAGTAAHATDHLELTAAGTLVVSDATDTGAVYFSCLMQCPDSAKTWWVLVDYLDANNYHACKIEFRYSGDTTRIGLYKVTAGTPTQIGTSSSTLAATHIAVDTQLRLDLCLTVDGLFIADVDGSNLGADGLTTRHSGGNKVGWLLDDATTLEIDDADWQTEKSERATCPTCLKKCSSCSGEFVVDVSGILNDACTNCADLLNAVFVIPQVCGCTFLLELGVADACDDPVDAGAETSFCDGLPFDRPYVRISTFVFGNFLALRFIYVAADGTFFTLLFTVTEVPDPDCEVWWTRTTTSVENNTTGCDVTGAVADIVFQSAA